MSADPVIAFLSGAVTLGYAVAGALFLKFRRRTGDRLFLNFAVAFWLFALNQLLAVILDDRGREIRLEYVLRVLGFVLILAGIVGKNMSSTRNRR